MAARKGSAKRTAPAAPGLGHGEYVVYPGTRAEVYDLLERLSAAAGDSPDFGTPGLSLDRSRLTVRWSGELPAAVRQVVDSAEGVTVTVQPTAFRPGDLRAEAERLVREHPDVVQAATARPEGDGIEVLVPPAVAGAAGGAEQALAGVASAFPLSAEVAPE
ncbi:hypothetical protein [Modestobacter versicolor]|uniref:Uncharacterized protein n=1 Tax=Modestobacter versicolor TaxID=429133 RepID=A0A323VBA0_9ACTN|nr:hypothetical protein [Modestobacter versicolor]MBB3677281.1 hypothetical protein [Modestobacter versicolor]PZA21460.1 hypothetical protein DMO24_10120 [Modestobacter versicolor]